jgi:tetratricopeptide (TPR) repeat protein
MVAAPHGRAWYFDGLETPAGHRSLREMRPLPTLVLSAAIAAVTAAAVSMLLRPEAPAVPDRAASAQDLAQLRTELETRLAAALAAGAHAATPHGERVAPPPTHPQAAAPNDARDTKSPHRATEASSAAAPPVAADLRAMFEELRGVAPWQDLDAWRRVQQAGKLDALLGVFRDQVAANPRDAKARMELANACLAAVHLEPSKFELSKEADQCYDAVLEVDANHWSARYHKAVSYTFWPDFMGKKADAIHHLDLLVKQQALLPVEPHHAQTYLVLGNLLEQRGEHDRALATWREGQGRHPDDEALRRRLSK